MHPFMFFLEEKNRTGQNLFLESKGLEQSKSNFKLERNGKISNRFIFCGGLERRAMDRLPKKAGFEPDFTSDKQ